MDHPTQHADRDRVLDDLTCWIVELNLAGVACERKVQDAARFAATAALRSGATPDDAMRASKAIVNAYLGLE